MLQRVTKHTKEYLMSVNYTEGVVLEDGGCTLIARYAMENRDKRWMSKD